MKENLISVIIPVYNVGNYLKKCIDSVTNQSYKKIEIILVDDGSTDSSGRICDEYKEKDVRIVVAHKENGGVSSARNLGVSLATGKYITFIDADDYIDTNTMEEVNKILEKNDVDYLKYNYIREYGVYKRKNNFAVKVNKIIGRENFETEIYPNLMKKTGDFSNIWNMVIKKSIADKISFNESKKRAEDVEYSFNALMLSNNVYVISSCLYHYVFRSNSEMNEPNQKKIVSRLIDDIDTFYSIYNFNPVLFREDFSRTLKNKISLLILRNHSKDRYFKYKKSISEDLNKLYDKYNDSEIIMNILNEEKKESMSLKCYFKNKFLYLISKLKYILKNILQH